MNYNITKKLFIVEELADVQIVNYIDFEKSGGKLSDLVEFYNNEFTKSQHSSDFKRNRYKSPESIVLVGLLNDKIVGLLESWIIHDQRTLVTIVVDSKYRGQGLFRDMFEDFVKRVPEEEIVLHFRDSNKSALEKVYHSIGFSDLKDVGEYSNGEIRWEMSYNKKFR